MGLVQSRSNNAEETVEVEGHRFTIEQNLRQMIPHHGELIVDFRQSLFGENFNVRFSRQGTC